MGSYKQACKQSRRAKKPLDASRLGELALAYVARFATSGARLERYLKRKVREQGWAEGEREPDIAALVARYAELGYIDDRGFATARSDSLLRRGYGARRVAQVLGQDGIAEDIRSDLKPDESRQRQAALAMASKRRFGPFGSEPPDRAGRERQLAAMLRAGHALDFAREMIDAQSVAAAESWAHELDGDDGFDG